MREYSRYEEQVWRPINVFSPRQDRTTLAWLLAGLGIGIGAALLFSPMGRDVRNGIARGCRSAFTGIGDRISRGTRELRRHGSDLIDSGREQVG